MNKFSKRPNVLQYMNIVKAVGDNPTPKTLYAYYYDDLEKYCDSLEKALSKTIHRLWLEEKTFYKKKKITMDEIEEWAFKNE